MLSAIELARDLEAGRTTVDRIFDACAEAIAEKEGIIRAFTALDLDAARLAAAEGRGPLAGLPFAVKDNIDTADLPTAYGSPIYAGHRPAADAAIVAQAKRLGAGIVGKTVTTEFAFFKPGPTRNPVKPSHTPGGSSSGSAAGIAAGFFALAIGTQTGGSVVRPAAFCGIAGFKPSYGILPPVGLKIFSWSLDTLGVFGKGVADAAFGAAALSGRDWRVDRQMPAAPHFALVRTHLWHEASGEMRVALENTARLAEKAGAKVSEVTLPAVFSDAFAAHQVIQDFEAALALGHEFDRRVAELSPILRETLAAGRAIEAADYDAARKTAAEAKLALKDLFQDFDAILTPSAPGTAPEGLGSTGSSIFNRVWTLMGVPAVNVPGVISAQGMPLGIQVVGARDEDHKALMAAKWLEEAIAKAD
ncbi:amidase [Stappia sp. F7233]|uniref:Amidase n=1 Tax=Stappia albiluteola TaxID=2758565 RepID=A0A839AG50_9HYPH|nr:amidase [Stappia albiluteola]MBA5777842.1 amidase [Stappia albiluteola]